MKVIYDKLPFKKKKCVATIGVFDGIHLGHRFVLEKVKKEALKDSIVSLVITFDVLPQQFLNNKSYYNSWKPRKPFFGCVIDFEQKIPLIKDLGIDYLWFLKTNQHLLRLSAREFVSYICRYFEIKEIIVGEDFCFGYQGTGDINLLKEISRQYGFKLTVFKKKKVHENVISSSYIRQLIRKGEFKEVKENLGRNFSLKGKVIRGKGLGVKLGFPTANIVTHDYVVPLSGVYSAYVIIKNKVYLGAVNIGVNPTIKKDKETVFEVHIINFCENISGKTIEIIFLEKIRQEHKFSSLDKLKAAIEKDIDLVISKYSVSLPKNPQLIVS